MKDITSGGAVANQTAVALGIFDGVHCGHRKIIGKAVSLKSKGLAASVFTFRTESLSFKHGKPFEYIYTNEEKLRILEKLGVDYAYSPDFENLRNLSGEEFFEEILLKKLKAKAAVCGDNFRFGKNAAWDVRDLRKMGEERGLEICVVPVGEDRFSSQKYREMLREGSVNDIYTTFGCGMYSIYGEVLGGNKIGRTLDFPTINQAFGERQLVPRKGVYRTITTIDGVAYDCVTNVGTKPTVEKDIKPLAETHILDFSGDLYGRKIEVSFLGFIRGEKKFGSLSELKKQVFADIDYVRRESAGVQMQKPIRKD